MKIKEQNCMMILNSNAVIGMAKKAQGTGYLLTAPQFLWRKEK
jgi:hypothetical protein